MKYIKEQLRKLRLFINKIGSKKRNSRILNKDVTIISNNCYAGIIYEYLNLPFNSPTIGLYFFAPEYIKFISNLKHYVTSDLIQIPPKQSKYYNKLKELHQDNKIIAKADDVEIVFLHYKTFKEAKEKWQRRCKRVNYSNIIYKFSDQNLCTEKEVNDFLKLKYKNKLFFSSKNIDSSDVVWLKKYKNKDYVKDDIYASRRYINIIDYINNIEGPKIFKKRIILLRSTSIKTDSRIQKESKTFIDLGYDVQLIGWDRENNFKRKESLNGVPVDFFKKSATYAGGMKNLLKMGIFQIYLFFKLFQYRKKYDIVFACDLDTGITARIFSKMFNKKLVYDIYDYYIESHYLSKLLKKIMEKQEIKTINNADVTIICTEQRKLQISKANPKKLVVIHNSPQIPMNLDKMPRISNTATKKKKIVYVGILQDDRLLLEVANAVKDGSKFELHIGGFGKYEEYFKDLSNKYENIYFYGPMSYDNVIKLESECDILFATYNPSIPNHKYSAPNKLYEAMALGKPIIVCKNTGIDKLVKKNNLGAVINYDVVDFVEKAEKLSNKDYSNSKDLFNKEYSWKVMSERLKEL